MRKAEIIGLTGHDDSPARALEVGKAAEHLVCAELILQGHRAFLSDQGLPYDVVVDVGRLIRIQVKSTFYPKDIPQITYSKKYTWHVRRVGKNGRRKIAGNEFDILALVALDVRHIAFIPISDTVPSCVMLRPPGPFTKSYRQEPFAKSVDQFPFADALEEVLCRA